MDQCEEREAIMKRLEEVAGVAEEKNNAKEVKDRLIMV